MKPRIPANIRQVNPEKIPTTAPPTIDIHPPKNPGLQNTLFQGKLTEDSWLFLQFHISLQPQPFYFIHLRSLYMVYLVEFLISLQLIYRLLRAYTRSSLRNYLLPDKKTRKGQTISINKITSIME